MRSRSARCPAGGARLAPPPPPRLQLDARQAARRRQRHLEPEAEPGAQRLLQRRAHARAVARADFHEDAGLVQLARAEDLDLELLDGREAPHDVLDGGRKDVHAAQDQHVVEAAEDRSEEHTSELQSLAYLVCRLLLEKKKTKH